MNHSPERLARVAALCVRVMSSLLMRCWPAPRYAALAGIALLGAVAAGSANSAMPGMTEAGQPGANDDVELGSLEWLQQRLEWGDTVTFPENVYMEYVTEVYPEGDEDLLRELVRRTANDITHPDRNRMEQLKRRLEHGPDVTTTRIWWGSEERFRVSQDFSSIPGFFADVARNGKSSGWHLNRSVLEFVDPRNPPQGRPVRDHPALSALDRFTGLHIASAMGVGPLGIHGVSVASDGETWQGWTQTQDGKRTYRIDGAYDRSSKTIRVLNFIALTSDDEPKFAGGGYRYLDRRHEPVTGRDVAFKVESFVKDGGVDRIMIIEEFRALRHGELEEAIRFPSAESADIVRGMLSQDHLVRGQATVLDRATAAATGRSGISEDNKPFSFSSQDEPGGLNRVFWGISVVVATGLLVYMCRRVLKK